MAFTQQSAKGLLDSARALQYSDYNRADSLIRLAILESRKIEDTDLLIQTYYVAGKIQLLNGWYDEAHAFLNRAVVLADSNSSHQWLAKSKIVMGEVFLDQGNMQQAVELSLEAIDIANEHKDTLSLIKATGSLAEIYRHYDYYDLALKYNRQVLDLAKRVNDQRSIGIAYNNMSATLGEQGHNLEAIDSLQSALKIIDSSNIYSRAKLTSNIGYCYRNLGEYSKALVYHRKALVLKRVGKMQSSIAYTLGAIGRAHIGLGNLDSGIYYAKKARALELEFKNPHQVSSATSHLATAYAAAGDYKNAYHFQQISDSISNQLFETETEHKVLLLNRKYDLSRKERELEEVNHQRMLERASQRMYLLLLVGLLLIALLIILLFRNRVKQKEQQKKFIELELSSVQLERERDQLALNAFTKDLMQKNKSIKELSEKLKKTEEEILEMKNAKSDELEQLSELKILTDDDWKRFKILFEKVHPNFFNKLVNSSVKYTKGEKRLMALIKLDMENNEIADTLGISNESVSKSRSRLKKKLESHAIHSIEKHVYSL